MKLIWVIEFHITDVYSNLYLMNAECKSIKSHVENYKVSLRKKAKS
jgi:hypothetical protein